MKITVDNVSYDYGTKRALSEVTFTLHSGLNILLGPNGAGKSTLYSLLTGLRKLSQGNILFNDKVMGKHRHEVMSNIGVVFQENTLDIDLTVAQNLSYFAALHGMDTNAALKNIDSVLSELELHERLNEKVRSLNGGHRRRVEIARSLLHKPNFLLFDEPTVGLDVDSRRLILKFVHNYINTNQSIVLWATHLLEEVQEQDRVLLLSKGRLKGFDTCKQLMIEHQCNNVSELFAKVTQTKKE